MEHPVLAALRDPPPGARIVLVVEGGGMRGATASACGLVTALLMRADVARGNGNGALREARIARRAQNAHRARDAHRV